MLPYWMDYWQKPIASERIKNRERTRPKEKLWECQVTSNDCPQRVNGKQSQPGSAVVPSMSSWWGINIIWHNGRLREGLRLPSTQWQAHYGVWPRGHDPKWGEPMARSRVRWQGQVRVTRESLWESESRLSCTRVGHLFTSPLLYTENLGS